MGFRPIRLRSIGLIRCVGFPGFIGIRGIYGACRVGRLDQGVQGFVELCWDFGIWGF